MYEISYLCINAIRLFLKCNEGCFAKSGRQPFILCQIRVGEIYHAKNTPKVKG